MLEFNRTVRQKKEVNLVPLINVIFLLLIFFMVAGRMESLDIFDINPPDSEISSDKSNPESNIYINKNGDLAVNNDIVSDSDFVTIIRTLLLENNEQKMIIKADGGLDSKKLIWVLDKIENLGGKNVLLVTESIK